MDFQSYFENLGETTKLKKVDGTLLSIVLILIASLHFHEKGGLIRKPKRDNPKINFKSEKKN